MTAELNGCYATACVTVPVGTVRASRMRLISTGHTALNRAIGVARAGTPVNHIGQAVQSTVADRGYAVCPELTGHGIGREIHEWPTVPNNPEPTLSQPLRAGLVIPTICAGSGAVFQDRDGWRIKTRDRTVAAHVEHTIVITDEAPIIITV